GAEVTGEFRKAERQRGVQWMLLRERHRVGSCRSDRLHQAGAFEAWPAWRIVGELRRIGGLDHRRGLLALAPVRVRLAHERAHRRNVWGGLRGARYDGRAVAAADQRRGQRHPRSRRARLEHAVTFTWPAGAETGGEPESGIRDLSRRKHRAAATGPLQVRLVARQHAEEWNRDREGLSRVRVRGDLP